VAAERLRAPRGDRADLEALLLRIDGRGYKAYKEIEGAWRYPDFVLHVDHVQGDPYAAPTRVRVILGPDVARLPASAHRGEPRALGTAALLARTFAHRAQSASEHVGTGKSGEIAMEHPGQTVMRQTAVAVDQTGGVEARFTVGLPADGRRVKGRAAAEMMGTRVPELVRGTLLAGAHDADDIERHAAANEDASALRAALGSVGLVAFVADGALLPRASGVDDRPLGVGAVPFHAPDSFRVEIDLPNAGTVSGMGVWPGVTLIVGGGFHGKSTLLRALEAGVYNHRPGDGRELVVTRRDAVKIRAEDGRSVASVDISGFIDGLPYGRDTHAFSSPNASGSTSQAAAIVEALEAGSRLLLVDEDTSATNFMIRDRRMQELVPAQDEPITPFVDRVRSLSAEWGVSCVLVIGGSGDYLDVADRVVRMADYQARDVTAEARAIAERLPTGREQPVGPGEAVLPPPRVLARGTLDPRSRHRTSYVRVPDERTLLFGAETIDLVAVEQLASRAQLRAIGQALLFAAALLDDRPLTVPALLDAIEGAVEREGLDALEPWRVGDLADFRRFELAAAMNRLRTLRVEESQAERPPPRSS